MENKLFMDIHQLEVLWTNALKDILKSKVQGNVLNILAMQTYDSIRRIEIYKTYKLRAENAVKEGRTFFDTSNPFILAQRPDLNVEDKIWILFLATYFGKSQKSNWELFHRASFRLNELISLNEINQNRDKYFDYLSSFDFFADSQFSNHRKYTKKALTGNKGLFQSMDYLLDNIDEFCKDEKKEFHEVYLISGKIPSFGRLASFDFTSTLVKCGLNVAEPKSMYADHSTGPLLALHLLLKLTKSNTSKQSQKNLSIALVEWFSDNSAIFMVGQVLEDAICNWQKNTRKYIYYKG